MTNLKRRQAIFAKDFLIKNEILSCLHDAENFCCKLYQLQSPVGLKQLCAETHFTKQEIKFIYRNFKNISPSALIHRDIIRNIFMNMFKGDTEHYADLIFNAFDTDRTGIITFEVFVLLRGDLNEKLEWIYSLYDPLKTGLVTWERIFYLITVTDDLTGIDTRPRLTKEERMYAADEIFKKFDSEKTNRTPVSRDKFIETCKTDETILQSLENMQQI